jgi:hypothetical protein
VKPRKICLYGNALSVIKRLGVYAFNFLEKAQIEGKTADFTPFSVRAPVKPFANLTVAAFVTPFAFLL